MYDALADRNITHVEHLYWHKTGLVNMASPTNRFCKSIEMATVGYYPNINAVPWNVDPNSKNRHNFIECKAVTKLAKNMYTDGKTPINVTEKPPELAQWILSKICRPRSTVLVIGAGAGDDIMGAIRGKMNSLQWRKIENNLMV